MYFTVESAHQARLPIYKTVLCVACVLILIVNSVSLFHNLQSLKGANFQLGQSARVADRLQYLNVLMLDAESSVQAYFISGSDSYLRPSKNAAAQVDKEFKELEQLLADNPSQLKNLAQLQALVRRRIALMNESIEVYRQGGLGDIIRIARISDGRAAMDEMRLLAVIMVQEQNETLETRSAGFYREYRKAVLLGMGINAVAILVLILFYKLVRRSFQNSAAVEYALQSANENLESMVAQRTEQLSLLSRHLISVSEEEKARLARELHDELGANLTAISMGVAAVTRELVTSRPDLAKQLHQATLTLLDTVELKRRIVEDLRPSLLDNLGLCAALQSYCEQFSRTASIKCDIDIDIDIERSESTLSIALFRIVQESLTNIMKYAKATQVSVSLNRADGRLTLRVIDNGIGIPDDTLIKPMSHGLLGMRERALQLGGSLTIRRGRANHGTCIEAVIPFGSAGINGGADPQASAETLISSGLHRRADDRIPSSQPYSIRPHSAPSLDDQ